MTAPKVLSWILVSVGSPFCSHAGSIASFEALFKSSLSSGWLSADPDIAIVVAMAESDICRLVVGDHEGVRDR